MPKLTAKWVEEVRTAFTAEVREAYLAELRAKEESKKKVEGYKNAIENTPVQLEYRRLCKLAKDEHGCTGWDDSANWVEANYPHIYYAIICHYTDASHSRTENPPLDRAKWPVEKILRTIHNGKRWDEKTRTNVAVDWVALEAELAPLMAKVMEAGQIPAEDGWNPDWRVWSDASYPPSVRNKFRK